MHVPVVCALYDMIQLQIIIHIMSISWSANDGSVHAAKCNSHDRLDAKALNWDVEDDGSSSADDSARKSNYFRTCVQ